MINFYDCTFELYSSFLNISISQGSVDTYLKCCWICNNNFIAHLLPSVL